MSKVAIVAEAVKEGLVGTEESPQLSTQSKSRFLQHATKDPQTGEAFMGVNEFIAAIVPKNEDFVST
jgi:solute carrier family 25 aspartate/glutamate transporter 12/13